MKLKSHNAIMYKYVLTAVLLQLLYLYHNLYYVKYNIYNYTPLR